MHAKIYFESKGFERALAPPENFSTGLGLPLCRGSGLHQVSFDSVQLHGAFLLKISTGLGLPLCRGSGLHQVDFD